jgi:hypothetical protein
MIRKIEHAETDEEDQDKAGEEFKESLVKRVDHALDYSIFHLFLQLKCISML